MLARRTLLAAPLAAAAPPLHAATSRDILVIAKQIDDLTSLDPHEGFEASGGEIISNVYEKLLIADPQDPSRLQGELAERQAPNFVQYCLTANVASVVERDSVLSHAVGGDLGNAWLRQNSAGSGPWVLRRWRANARRGPPIREPSTGWSPATWPT